MSDKLLAGRSASLPRGPLSDDDGTDIYPSSSPLTSVIFLAVDAGPIWARWHHKGLSVGRPTRMRQRRAPRAATHPPPLLPFSLPRTAQASRDLHGRKITNAKRMTTDWQERGAPRLARLCSWVLPSCLCCDITLHTRAWVRVRALRRGVVQTGAVRGAQGHSLRMFIANSAGQGSSAPPLPPEVRIFTQLYRMYPGIIQLTWVDECLAYRSAPVRLSWIKGPWLLPLVAADVPLSCQSTLLLRVYVGRPVSPWGVACLQGVEKKVLLW